jgi:hypothetical protein
VHNSILELLFEKFAFVEYCTVEEAGWLGIADG